MTVLGYVQEVAISIHALHEESDRQTVLCHGAIGISIHALHEESDQQSADHAVGRHISIHALHEESDCVTHGDVTPPSKFQSTLSMRRATDTIRDIDFINIISIHALHEESD